ncbi:MAG TPA: M48 family metallopeptidase [Acidobacteriaceae bacterium]
MAFVPVTYTLPPVLYAKAVALGRLMVDLHFAHELLPIVLLLVLLYLRVPAWMANRIGISIRRPWLQKLIFAAAFILLLQILVLPLSIIGHHIVLRFGLSIQRWPSWFADVAKSEAITVAIGTLLAAILYFLLGRSPRLWWLWLWIIVVPLMVAGVVLTPLVIDPLFNKFEPLAQTDPVLVAQLERVVERSSISIPPDRIFLMRASAKVTETNAYVTGFGSSKRVVVWDTTLRSTPPDQIDFMFGHELGHYVLHHIVYGMLFAAALMLLCFWLGAHVVAWLLGRFGPRWGIVSLQDSAILAIMLLVFTIAQFATEPMANAFSRHIEHQADIYGQEAMHGLVPDPAATAARGFQALGEQNLASPERRPLVEFWYYSHPAIADRISFAAEYHPWSEGAQPVYFRK